MPLLQGILYNIHAKGRHGRDHIKWLRGDSLKKKTWANHYLEFDSEIIRGEYLKYSPELAT
jgi:hypothetical protein